MKRGLDRRPRAGHPWIYRGEIADLAGAWSAGLVVTVVDADRRFLGRGFYNPRPSVACRLLTRRDEAVDAGLFLDRLRAALAYRHDAGLAGDGFRVCWSEADGLPGLVVDRYASVTVVQCSTLGMARAAAWVTAALGELFPGAPVFRADDPTAARVEGFEPLRGWVGAPGPGTVVIQEGACQFAVAPGEGHKTGFYLDQRENREVIPAHAEGRRVLDAFCYTGAFACHALRAGAQGAVLIDSSAAALAEARENLALNGVADHAELRDGNVFDLLRRSEADGERFGLIVLDPPPFTRRKDALEAAVRGYKEINLRALRLLEPGGTLATFSCSHHMTPGRFEETCRDAAGDAGVAVRVLAALGQSRDHPVVLAVPETRYLTGLLLQRM